MLKSRLLTAFLIGPLVLWAIYAMPENLFALLSLILVSIGAWEWAAFAGWVKPFQRGIFIAANILLFITILFLQNFELNIIILLASLLWWLICIPLLVLFPFKENNILHTRLVKTLVGIFLLLGTLVAMLLLRNNPDYGSEFVLYLILTIWFADSGAYFAGRALGKTKLMPNVSPGKTWEGVAGAIAITLIGSSAALYVLNIPSEQSFYFIFLAVVTVAYSIVGDLSESMFKRMANLKDSGNLLPGHGGILDRIDSLMSGFPIFVAGLWLMEQLA